MSDIRLDPRNARKHPDKNKAAIRQSLQEVGAFRSIAVDGDGIVRAGNGVFEQAQALGLKLRIIEAAPDELIAVQRPDLRGEKAERAAILDNWTGESSEWDAAVLDWLKKNQPETVQGLWTSDEWRSLLRFAPTEETGKDTGGEEDKAGELQEKWGTELGQLWIIPSRSVPGKAHRMMCGDSTNLEHVKRLMNGERAVLFATDPPYLVDYDGTNHPGGKDWSKHYIDEDLSAQGSGLYDGFIQAAKELAITEDAAWYCWHASRQQRMVEDCWERHGAFVHQQIVWVKNRPVFTRSWYLWAHEPCFFGWLKGKKPHRMTEEFLTSVWTLDFPGGDLRVEHPTQKPIEVFTIPMEQHTAPGELCYEPFSGSGSQLAAGETVGRIVYAMEVAPAFVAVALERLAGMGLEPRLEE